MWKTKNKKKKKKKKAKAQQKAANGPVKEKPTETAADPSDGVEVE